MKKLIILVLCILLIGGLSGCGPTNIDESIDEFGKNPLSKKVISNFSAKDLEGNEITNEIFKENDLTVINIWGTECPPCIEEIPELQKLQDEVKDKKVKVIGVVGDKDIEAAKKILSTKKANYTNIIPDENLEKEVVYNFDYIPATIFVNSKGEVLDTFIPGATNFESIKTIVENILSDEN
ncbi:MAG: TlpA family protein disulfide reductase [Tepidibacter sp.]|jgi:thiol-disulfide isomerase/thioredoxin|uniref:TlpA family protein disulfide reductase n=1 Tax=Tepidibacter sp. TaxID=2529387 RepID=UPI0025FB976C|nr:TlpA disulfide reductase family protein [Tepidibacter sp.]MCT4508301.1 TlpA family protein disulfide reductase [Tepidibacter sp.]